MLKKNEVLEALENGAHISINEILYSATVCDKDGNVIDTCRYDTAMRIAKMDGYEIAKLDGWCYYKHIRKAEPKPDDNPSETLYINLSTIRTDTTTSATQAMSWHRAGDTVRVDRGYKCTDIHGAPQPAPKTRDDENRDHCKRIAEELEAYTNGTVYRCPECGETLELPADVGDKYKCPHCGTVSEVDELEQLSVWDYLEDALDIEYRIGSDKQYRSVRIMVTCGGPNIYIDTASKSVELYWWGDRASYPISTDATDAVDEWAEELYQC